MRCNNIGAVIVNITGFIGTQEGLAMLLFLKKLLLKTFRIYFQALKGSLATETEGFASKPAK